MKNTIILPLLFISAFAFTQSNNSCIFLLNGKQFERLGDATKDDLLDFCSLQVKDTRTNKLLQPVSYEWVYSSYGKITKGDLHSCARLVETIRNMKHGDVLFIDKIKYKGFTGLCEGQFAVTLQ